jgi:hypothetical protein
MSRQGAHGLAAEFRTARNGASAGARKGCPPPSRLESGERLYVGRQSYETRETGEAAIGALDLREPSLNRAFLTIGYKQNGNKRGVAAGFE